MSHATGTTSSTPLITLQDVSVVYKVRRSFFGGTVDLRAVDGVSLDIFPGEVVALVGESGCGKTTLGKVIVALLRPTTGKVLYKGKDVWSLSKNEWKNVRRNLQIIHQNPYDALNPTKRVFQILSIPLKEYKLVKNSSQLRDRIYELLEMVGLRPEIAEKYPHQLSGGQLQRVAIARAISLHPELIVADEPVSMIDVSLRIDILDLLLKLRHEFNLASIFITHDLGLARYYAYEGRIVVMYVGNIVEIGPTEEVIRNPLHPYTQALLSVVPVPNPKLARERKEIPLRSIEIANAIAPPSGCKFHPRCIYATDKCRKVRPRLVKVGNDRWIACHLVGK